MLRHNGIRGETQEDKRVINSGDLEHGKAVRDNVEWVGFGMGEPEDTIVNHPHNVCHAFLNAKRYSDSSCAKIFRG